MAGGTLGDTPVELLNISTSNGMLSNISNTKNRV